MNFIKPTLLSAFLTLITLPCFSQGIVSVDILRMQEKGDSLHISYAVKAIEPNVSSSQGLHIIPVIAAGDSLLVLPHITLLGSNKEKVIDRYRNNTASNKTKVADEPATIKNNEERIYTVSVPYRMWMDSARLSIRQQVTGW